MIDRFGQEIEGGRIAGDPGTREGAFRLACHASGRALLLIVSAGDEWFIEGLPGPAWEHVSISVPAGGVPRWEEMCWVKRLFWKPEECVVQYHPPEADYVNVHAGVLHLWRPVGVAIPMPPRRCV